MLKHTRLFLGFVAVASAFLLLPQNAYAQALSAQGVATGGNKVSAIVPQAGRIYTIVDELTALDDAIINCAEQGMFVANAANPTVGDCRKGVPPEVIFCQDGEDASGNSSFCADGTTFVRVQNPLPDDDHSTHPNPLADSNGLNGRDGRCIDDATGSTLAGCVLE